VPLSSMPTACPTAPVAARRPNHPISVTISNGIVYVLNGGTSNCLGGETDDHRLPTRRCGHTDADPRVDKTVSGGALSGCTQVSFAPAATSSW
jgi:hypothetical protein